MGQEGPLLWPGAGSREQAGGSLPQCVASFIVFFKLN